MTRIGLLTLAAIALSIVISAMNSAPVEAYPQFKKAFDTKYLGDKTTPEQMSLDAEVKKAKCNVCHEGKSKKMRNAYGKALGELLGKEDKNDTDKIMKALETVESKKAEGASESFGDALKKGHLPVK